LEWTTGTKRSRVEELPSDCRDILPALHVIKSAAENMMSTPRDILTGIAFQVEIYQRIENKNRKGMINLESHVIKFGKRYAGKTFLEAEEDEAYIRRILSLSDIHRHPKSAEFKLFRSYLEKKYKLERVPSKHIPNFLIPRDEPHPEVQRSDPPLAQMSALQQLHALVKHLQEDSNSVADAPTLAAPEDKRLKFDVEL
jgi:hypothetical protein